MSDQARKEVNDALVSTGSSGVGQMVDTANSSKFKREQLKADKARREEAAADKTAADKEAVADKEKDSGA